MENKRREERENKLLLIPKTEKYIEYMLNIILKLPRTEKFNIGNEYKISMYKLLENVMMLNKLDRKEYKEMKGVLNKVDSILNTQRIYLRIMRNSKWIDDKRFKAVMEMIYEVGKILGGLIKYYAKDNQESV